VRLDWHEKLRLVAIFVGIGLFAYGIFARHILVAQVGSVLVGVAGLSHIRHPSLGPQDGDRDRRNARRPRPSADD